MKHLVNHLLTSHLGRIALVMTVMALGASVLQWFGLYGFDRNELSSTSSGRTCGPSTVNPRSANPDARACPLRSS